MGRRSRKRAGSAGTGTSAPESPAGSSRAERDAARARHARAAARGDRASGGGSPDHGGGRRHRGRARRARSIDERPPAPWGKFPLVELVVLLAIVLFVAGLVIGGTRGGV